MKKKISILITAMFLTILCFSPQASACVQLTAYGLCHLYGVGLLRRRIAFGPYSVQYEDHRFKSDRYELPRCERLLLPAPICGLKGRKEKRPSMLPICILKERREPLTFHRTLFARSAI